jgi:spore coat protein H
VRDVIFVICFPFILMLSACVTDSAMIGIDRSYTGDCTCANDASLSDGDSRELFDYPRVPLFDICLPHAAWENLKAHSKDEEYVEARACFEGRYIGRVGVRFKGSYGSLYNCFDENDRNICRKLGIKLKFDEYDRGNRFFGLKRLNFQGYRYDDTYIRERLAYDLFRAMGIAAPRSAWAMLRVNGEFLGLFGMVEQVDGRFTKDRWPDNPDGNLYKEVWPVTTDRDWIASHLKTNGKAANVDAFLAFAGAMIAAADDGLGATLGRFADLDYLARYMAVDDAIASYDGITAYYTSEDLSFAGNHNYYFYEESANRFTIIPWDQESTFTVDSGFGSVPRWTCVPDDCRRTYRVWGGQNLVIAPGCDRVFRAMAADRRMYREACAELLHGPFTENAMYAAIDAHAAFIRQAVRIDPHGPGIVAFERGIRFLESQIPKLRNRLKALMNE